MKHKEEAVAKVYNLFISHSWSYPKAYDGLVGLLNKRSYFFYNNFSVPKDDPIHITGTDTRLYNAIKNKMTTCHVVIIMAGVYATYSKWISKEIDIAKSGFLYPKPILAVRPWAQTKVSTLVSQNADDFANWNTESIIGKIRALTP